MSNIQPLLEYQKIDIQLKKLLIELEKHDDNRKLEQAKTEFNAAKLGLIESEKAAESAVKFFSNAEAYYDENLKKIEEMAKEIESTDNEMRRKELLNNLTILKDKFADLEKKLAERAAKSESIIRSYLEIKEKGKKLRDIYINIKARLEDMRNSKSTEINALKGQLDKLRPSIDKTLFDQYAVITADNKYPAFVPALSGDKKSFSCGGCGMQLSQKELAELEDKSYTRCETCRRINYKV